MTAARAARLSRTFAAIITLASIVVVGAGIGSLL